MIAAATGFRGYDKVPDLSEANIHARCAKTLDALAGKSWAQIKAAHVADHQRLFRRVTLQLASTSEASSLPTNERLKRYATQPDPSLAALYFQYGRYLLIASSRPHTPGRQPAGHLERRAPSTVEFELHHKHQRPDELLAGGNLQSRRLPCTRVRFH